MRTATNHEILCRPMTRSFRRRGVWTMRTRISLLAGALTLTLAAVALADAPNNSPPPADPPDPPGTTQTMGPAAHPLRRLGPQRRQFPRQSGAGKGFSRRRRQALRLQEDQRFRPDGRARRPECRQEARLFRVPRLQLPREARSGRRRPDQPGRIHELGQGLRDAAQDADGPGNARSRCWRRKWPQRRPPRKSRRRRSS